MVNLEGHGTASRRASTIFGRVFERGLVAHAYLLTGPEGSGKADLARKWAQLLLCLEPRIEGGLPEPCGRCPACRKALSDVHPDLEIVRPDGAMIKVDQVRRLQKALAFPPLEGPRRVCLVFEADRMNPDAANALLKTLEEPPTGTHLILTAPSPHALLPTIVSRCQRIHSGQVDSSSVGQWLAKEAGLGERGGALLGYLAEGSLGRAEALAASDVLAWRDRFFEILAGPMRATGLAALFGLIGEVAASPDTLLLFARLLRTVVRDLLLLSGAGKGGRPSHGERLLHGDHSDGLGRLLARCAGKDLLAYDAWLESLDRLVDRNLNRELLAEAALLFWVGGGTRLSY